MDRLNEHDDSPSAGLPFTRALRLLLVEDSDADAVLIVATLKRAGYPVLFDTVATASAYRERLRAGDYDIVLADHNLITWMGMDALAMLKDRAPDIPFVVVTATLGDEAAVEYIKQGAADYVLKHRLERLPIVVGQVLRQKAFRQQERLLQELILCAKRDWELTFDTVPEPILVFDQDCRVRRANRAASEMVQLPFAQLIGRRCHEVLGGLADLPADCRHRAHFEGLKPAAPLPDPARVYESSCTQVRGAAGESRGCVHVMRDVTERHQAQERLRIIAKDALDLYNRAPCGYHTFGPDLVLRRINDTELAWLGYTREEVVGRMRITGLLSARTVEQFERDLPLAVTRDFAPDIEGEMMRKDGTGFPCLLNATYIRGDDGALLEGRVSVVDISRIKAAEIALRESERKYREQIENTTYGVFRSTPDGRFLEVNPALVRILGYDSAEQVLALNLATDVYRAPEERQAVLAAYSEAERTHIDDLVWRRKDGSFAFVHSTGREVRDLAGHTSHYEVIVEDVTQQHALEAQFRQAQKMEAIGRLAGGVAHDFNNLLAVIMGNADLLADTLPADESMRKRIADIQSAAERAASLTQRLLAFSRKQTLEPRILNLNALIQDTSKLLMRVLGEDITVLQHLDPHLGLVKADQAQIEQVLMNVVINARDAMPRGGTLTIDSANVELDEAYIRQHRGVVPGPYCLLAVSDTGIGMDEETRARIFEPFFTTKDEGKGTGLGLAMVYGFVTQSGGYIWVYSEVGKGTTFKIYFPRVAAELHKQQPKSGVRECRRGSETVLVAEDEEALRHVHEEVLSWLGYTVLSAANGEEAIALAEQHRGPIHLLLTDVVMPGLSGREVAARVLQIRPGIGIVYTSGYTNDEMLRRGILENGCAFLQKPFTREGLARKVREVLEACAAAPVV